MYEQYLQELLKPLGLYTFSEDSISGAELYAIGQAMDGISAELETAERECLTATAEGKGLALREALFARKNGAETLEERREAIAALLQIDGDSLTPQAMARTLRGCGLRVEVLEQGDGKVRVMFPDVGGEPEGFAQIREIVLDILPCHLEVEFYFNYLTWERCEALGFTWQIVEDAAHTWESFMVAMGI